MSIILGRFSARANAVLPVLLLAGLCGPSASDASPADHLQCFKVKDSVAKAAYTVDVAPGDPTFPGATACVVRLPAKMLCVDAVKSNVVPTPPGAPDGSPAQEYLCYKTKCPKALPTATRTDQFGTHNVAVKSTSLLCAPVAASTTVTTIPTTTTTLPPTCEVPAACPGGSECINLADNAGQSVFALRLAQVTLSKPTTLASGAVGAIIRSLVPLDEPACNLGGQGTFSWLLRFDTAAQTLEVGGAKPVSDPTEGYTLLGPVTTAVGVAGTGAFSAAPVDVTLPVYLDAGGTQSFPLALRRASLVGQLSTDQNCIGTYNAAGLLPPDCSPDSTHPQFLDAGTVHAHITLEDADLAIIAPIGQSLCVVLSGDATTYGDGGNPARCKRVDGTILFQGDYCSATDAPGGCADSVELQGNFAASGVTINGTESTVPSTTVTTPSSTTSTTSPCPLGQTFCFGKFCADLTTDMANCGFCGFACDAGQTCVGGGCR